MSDTKPTILENLPEELHDALCSIEQAVGELVFLRRLLDSIKEEAPSLVDQHSRKLIHEMGWSLDQH